MKQVGVVIAALVAACGDNVRPPCGDPSGLPDAWRLSADGIDVEIGRSPYAITVRDRTGRIVLESLAGGGDGYGAVAWTSGSVEYERFVVPGWFSFFPALDPWRDRFDVVAVDQRAGEISAVLAAKDQSSCVQVKHIVRASALRVEANGGDQPRAWAAGFSTPADEGFLGFGERFNRTDQRGGNVFAWAEEGGLGVGEDALEGRDNPFPSGEMMTYYPVPFFLSTEGYGFWLDTTYRNEFNLASERADGWRAWHVGPSLAYEVYVAIPDDPRPWPYHIIDRFTEAVGRPMLPPTWTFGPRRRIGAGATVDGVPEVQAMRDNDLAITAIDDAIHFYPSASHVGAEVGLASWIAQAEALGYRVNGYYNSFVDRAADADIAPWAEQGLDGDYYLRTEEGELPDLWILTGANAPQLYLVDFTNPAATAWYQSSFDWANDLGYSGWMYDFGEYVPANARGADGTSGEALHNLYPVLQAKAVHDALEGGPRAGDWLAFMRSGYTGASAYVPMVWSGDPAASFEAADGLPSMVPAAISLGISGAPHSGGDIGGFHCSADGAEAADEELLTRWIQQGSMSSNMQDQNACVGGDRSLKATIWTAPAARQAWRQYARLHTRLFPYLYTLAHEASATGAPTMRHVFLEHPDRKDLRGVDDAYYLGPALYVAPVLARGAREKTVSLPGGRYVDWTNQTLIEGDREITLPAPLDVLPLLIRENHLIPLLDPSIDTLSDREATAGVIRPTDVADVYDVVGLVTSRAQFKLFDGDQFDVVVSGTVAPPALPEASSEQELSTCSGCFLLDTLPDGGQRLRVSSESPTIAAGGVQLSATTDRRIRWDIYLCPDC